MEFERFASDPLSRRRFLRAAGVATAGGGSAALLAACGGGSGNAKDKSAIAADIATLNRALDLENTAVAAYTAGAPLLKGGVIKLARELLGQDKEHADASGGATYEQQLAEYNGTTQFVIAPAGRPPYNDSGTRPAFVRSL